MALSPGTRLGPYEIVEQIGAGGMGEVYRALDTRLGRDVAVKILPPAYAHDQTRRLRLEREARAASALNHPNIVTIHDIGSDGGHTFVVMELVRGMTLTQLIPPDGLDLRVALNYAQQMAAALQTAHAAGVLHRDIKPGNVMVTAEGLVKVMDFGLAKIGPFALDGETQSRFAHEGPLTQEGSPLGTFAYMSPEQARGEPLDVRSEIFSFGIVLYEMIAGRRPFAGNNPYSTMEAICLMDPPSLGELRIDLSPGVSRLVRRCLAKAPGERPQSFGDVIDELRALQSASSSSPAVQPLIDQRREWPVTAPSASARPPSSSVTPRGERPAVPGRDGSTEPVAPESTTPRPSPVAVPRSWRPWVVGVLVVATAVVAYALLSRSSGGGGAKDTAATGSSATAYDQVAEGRALLEHYDRPGNVDRAVELFESACRARPDYAPAFAGLAEALWRQVVRDPDRAVLNRGLEAARKAVALEDQMASAHALLGLLWLQSGEPDRARASVARALELDPRSRIALLAQSDVHMASDDTPAAEAVARQAADLYPDEWTVHSALGYVLFRQSRFADAAASFEEALRVDPGSVRTLSNLAGVYHMLGRTEDAANALQRAIEIAPSTRTYNNLGTLRYFQGRYEESMRLFEKTVELAPNTYVYWGNLGDARRWVPAHAAGAAEAYQTAMALVRKHLDATPGDKEARSALASYLAKTGRHGEAVAELEQATDEQAGDFFYTATVVYELAGQRERALAALDRAVALGYSPTEIEADPELIDLRRDSRFHRLLAKER